VLLKKNLYFFFKTIFLFNGAHKQKHNDLLTQFVVFNWNKTAFLKFKMINLQLKILILLLNSVHLNKKNFAITSYDRAIGDVLENLEDAWLTRLNTTFASKWFNHSSTFNRFDCLSEKAFRMFKSSVLFKPSFVLNFSNIEGPTLRFLLQNKSSLLLSLISNSAKYLDYQYYLPTNTTSLFVNFFFFNFFKKLVLKKLLSQTYENNLNFIRFRFWYGLHHLFLKQFLRKCILLQGLLNNGLVTHCLKKLFFNYKKIALYNIYSFLQKENKTFFFLQQKDFYYLESSILDNLEFLHDAAFFKIRKNYASKVRNFFLIKKSKKKIGSKMVFSKLWFTNSFFFKDYFNELQKKCNFLISYTRTTLKYVGSKQKNVFRKHLSTFLLKRFAFNTSKIDLEKLNSFNIPLCYIALYSKRLFKMRFFLSKIKKDAMYKGFNSINYINKPFRNRFSRSLARLNFFFIKKTVKAGFKKKKIQFKYFVRIPLVLISRDKKRIKFLKKKLNRQYFFSLIKNKFVYFNKKNLKIKTFNKKAIRVWSFGAMSLQTTFNCFSKFRIKTEISKIE
jgi:hypothetical protein